MDMNKLMKQAQQMQKQMDAMQNKMGEMEVEGSAGGGLVKIVMTGKGDAKRASLDPKVVDADDVEMLEDLVVAAINDAKGKAEKTMNEEMAKVTGGMGMPPGFKMPF